jgi:hypothetical protein
VKPVNVLAEEGEHNSIFHERLSCLPFLFRILQYGYNYKGRIVANEIQRGHSFRISRQAADPA